MIWDGIVLYVGNLFGYFVFYGCICLFMVFVKKFYGIIGFSFIMVIIFNVSSVLKEVDYFGLLVLMVVDG